MSSEFDDAGAVLADAGSGGLLPGPWDVGFWCSLPLAARSKSNFRRGRRDRTWSGLASFESSVGFLVSDFVPDRWRLGDASCPVAERPKVLSYLFARTLLDSPNLPKSVFDALEGVLFHTDASVRFSASATERCRAGETMFLCFAQTDTNSFAELAEMFASLTAACVPLLPR